MIVLNAGQIRDLGDELVVLDASGATAHLLSGDQAVVVRALPAQNAAAVALATGLARETVAQVLAELSQAGLLNGGTSRRAALGLVGAVAGAGVLTVALPHAAAALSGVGGGGGTTAPAAPLTLTANKSAANVTPKTIALQWTASTTAGVTYRLRTKTTGALASGDFSPTAPTGVTDIPYSGTSATYTPNVPALTGVQTANFYFGIVAVNANGNSTITNSTPNPVTYTVAG